MNFGHLKEKQCQADGKNHQEETEETIRRMSKNTAKNEHNEKWQ